MKRIVLLAGISLMAFAQETTQEFDVRMQPATGAQGQRGFGGSGSGECEIRVRIDQKANVDVRGRRVRVRTLQGAPSYNQGSWCTGPVPDNPSDFRFQKGSGRGNSSLSQTPNPGNGGTARIYIEDQANGRDLYTFRLSWSGGSSGGGGGGWGGANEWSSSGRGTVDLPGMRVTRVQVRINNNQAEIRLDTQPGEFRIAGRVERRSQDYFEVEVTECGSGSGRMDRCQGRARVTTNGRDVRRIEANGSTSSGRYTVNFQR